MGTPLSGYTGHMRRIEASNIFGETFANSIMTADHDQTDICTKRTSNMGNLSSQVPKVMK